MDKMTQRYNIALEQQGYMVIAFLGTVPTIGSVIDHHIDGVEGPFQAVDVATKEDFLNQTRRFNPDDLLYASMVADQAKAFLKVKAE